MVYVRRRYYFWLARAYLKRWRRTILFSLIFGIIAFFIFAVILNIFILPLFKSNVKKIGYAGSYTLSTLPPEVLRLVSYGLTKVNYKGQVESAAAKNWEIRNEGKVFIFTLKNNLKFSNGKNFTAVDVPYEFKDVKKEIISPYKIKFTLKDKYSPFLSVVSKPIIYKNYGLLDYFISKTELNSGFLKEITLKAKKGNKKINIIFYPTQEALKTAFFLGEIDEIKNYSNGNDVSSFKNWKNIKVSKATDYTTLVTLFFNTLDNSVSNKKVRQALVYSLPTSFSEGKRNYSFLPETSIYYSQSPNQGIYDTSLSKELLQASGHKDTKLKISTSDEYLNVAKKIAKEWEKIGIKTEIITTNEIPVNFQILLFPLSIPLDPDMYSLWHSGQKNNISHYSSVRIDKLLEEGRQTTDTAKRVQIYADVQKYLLDDSPAAFLYFPYIYNIKR